MIFYRTIQRPQAMTFDLDDTLYDNLPHMRRAETSLFCHIAKHHPKAADKERHFWLNHKKRLLDARPELASDMGELRRLTLSAGFTELEYRGRRLTEAVTDCFEYFYFERSNFEVADEITSVLADLAENIPLVAITNGNVNLQQIGLSEYFTTCFKASLTSPMKPNKYMYELASEHLQLPANKILHIGDNLEKDIYGAQRAGYRTAWYADNRVMQLAAEPVTVLPDIQLSKLAELLTLVG